MNLYLVTTAVLALPIGMLTYSLMKEQKKKKVWLALAQAYERLLWEEKLSVEQSEIVGNKVIALDRRSKKLLLLDYSGAQPLERCFSLREIAATRIVEKRDALQACVQRILLELNNGRTGELLQFCFYDENHDPLTDLKRLTRKAVQWKTRIDVHRSSGNVSREMDYVL